MSCVAEHPVFDLKASLAQLHGEFRYVLTARFNQDVVENWFSAVHAKGFNNDSRTTTDYEYAVKNIAVNWLLDQPEKTRNCMEDGDSFLTVLDNIRSMKAMADKLTSATEECNTSTTDVEYVTAAAVSEATTMPGTSSAEQVQVADDIGYIMAAAVSETVTMTPAESSLISDWPEIFALTEVDANVAYICGYLCMKLVRRNDCALCSVLCCSQNEYYV